MQTSLLWVVVWESWHNLLEPATFGVPIIVGPNYSHFAEAIALVNMGGCISVSNKAELNAALKDLQMPTSERKGHICSTFVQMNKELQISS
jgi:3-deoxy-D-manno-octulosonic-acid transferase